MEIHLHASSTRRHSLPNPWQADYVETIKFRKSVLGSSRPPWRATTELTSITTGVSIAKAEGEFHNYFWTLAIFLPYADFATEDTARLSLPKSENTVDERLRSRAAEKSKERQRVEIEFGEGVVEHVITR